MRIRAQHYVTGQPVDIVCESGSIHALSSPTSARADHEATWVAPALFDLQINGGEGRSFSSATLTPDDVRHVVRLCQRHGIGNFCPTLVTNSFATLAHGLTVLRQSCEKDAGIAAAMPAFHLEGPYISAEDGPRGAHPRPHVRPPNWDEFRRFQDAAGGRIRLVTLAPEQDGALRFIESLVSSGVVVALGHTAATGARIREAIRAGARLSSHLGNGAHAMLPRHENYLWEQLAADELWASVITDGHHLPAAVVKCIIRVKTPARTILTCDAGSLAGLPPGRYQEWDQEFEVDPSGKIVVPGTDYLAGAGVFTDSCIGTAIRFAGVRLDEALDMAGARPRALLDLPPVSIAVGSRADLVLFDWEEGGEIRVTGLVLGGVHVA